MEPTTAEGYLFHVLKKFHSSETRHVKQLEMRREIQSLQFWRSVIAECLSTFFYTFLVCAVSISWGGEKPSILQVALAAGFVATTLNHCFGHISGGYINPAVTIAFMLLRKMTIFRSLLYIVAQCGGAIAGAALLYRWEELQKWSVSLNYFMTKHNLYFLIIWHKHKLQFLLLLLPVRCK